MYLESEQAIECTCTTGLACDLYIYIFNRIDNHLSCLIFPGASLSVADGKLSTLDSSS